MNGAYQTLSDPTKRKLYDRWGERGIKFLEFEEHKGEIIAGIKEFVNEENLTSQDLVQLAKFHEHWNNWEDKINQADPQTFAIASLSIYAGELFYLAKVWKKSKTDNKRAGIFVVLLLGCLLSLKAIENVFKKKKKQ